MSATVTLPRESVARAKTALEHRLRVTETVMLPQARELRNLGIVEALEEGIHADRLALKEIEEALQ